ncbi:hypothetical protein PSY24_23530, partial [Shigella flexneri]|nr:hypothetical protein [Shigella flexneri]
MNINGNFISEEGIDELKDIFKESPDKLGQLDENDPEGEDFDDNGDEDEDSQDELELKLQNLDV